MTGCQIDGCDSLPRGCEREHPGVFRRRDPARRQLQSSVQYRIQTQPAALRFSRAWDRCREFPTCVGMTESCFDPLGSSLRWSDEECVTTLTYADDFSHSAFSRAAHDSPTCGWLPAQQPQVLRTIFAHVNKGSSHETRSSD